MHLQEHISRRRLPHWDVPEAAYFITSCLEGSLSAQGLVGVEPSQPQDDGEQRRDRWKRLFVRMDHHLDHESPVRHLADRRLAQIVVDALYYFAGERYDLLAFVVMPSHFHWVFQPLPAWVERLDGGDPKRSPRQRIQHSINRYTGLECNAVRGTTGSFWQRESYDHWVRDVEELERIMRYIEANPVAAGLVESPEAWPFSSAHDRAVTKAEFGSCLVRVPCQEKS